MNKTLLTNKKEVIAIVGPTASGKTAAAIELAKQIDGEIISADSRLVYKGFNIGTAKPTEQEKQGIPHYLIDIVEPEFDYSAGLYKKDAELIINQIIEKGKTPIITGGTGLYIDILLKNYDMPQIEPNYELRNKLKALPKEQLWETLKNMDIEAADSIDINDSKKIIRAIEIIKATGKPLNQSRGVNKSNYKVTWIGKNFDRQTLYNRIDNRVDRMIEMGLVDETKSLLAKHGRIQNLIHTIGYKEILSYIDGKTSLKEATDLLKKNTKNYAKRQLTWFRRNPEIKWDIYPEKLKK